MFRCADLLFYWRSLVKDKSLSRDGWDWLPRCRSSPPALSSNRWSVQRKAGVDWTQIQSPTSSQQLQHHHSLIFQAFWSCRAVCPYSTWMLSSQNPVVGCLGIKFSLKRNCLVREREGASQSVTNKVCITALLQSVSILSIRYFVCSLLLYRKMFHLFNNSLWIDSIKGKVMIAIITKRQTLWHAFSSMF